MNVSSNRHKYTSDIDHAVFNKTLIRQQTEGCFDEDNAQVCYRLYGAVSVFIH